MGAQTLRRLERRDPRRPGAWSGHHYGGGFLGARSREPHRRTRPPARKARLPGRPEPSRRLGRGEDESDHWRARFRVRMRDVSAGRKLTSLRRRRVTHFLFVVGERRERKARGTAVATTRTRCRSREGTGRTPPSLALPVFRVLGETGHRGPRSGRGARVAGRPT